MAPWKSRHGGRAVVASHDRSLAERGIACASCTKTVDFGQKLRVQDRLISAGNGLTFAGRRNVTGTLGLLSYMYIVNEMARRNGALSIAILASCLLSNPLRVPPRLPTLQQHLPILGECHRRL